MEICVRNILNDALIDDLTMYYDGNRLTDVRDDAGCKDLYATKEYEDLSDLPNAMQYDGNGNLAKDKDRRIDTIYYNLLNQPTTIVFHNGNRTEYHYSADGQKQRAYYRTMREPLLMGEGDSIVGLHIAEETEIWYSGNREKYRARRQDSVWRWYKEIVYNDEGYTEFALNDTSITDIQQYYYRKDHIGNIVAVWNATKEETPQRMFYYASGLPMGISTGQDLQARKYGGKEFDEMHGLNEYDSEARRYYPAICRTTTIDPLCKKYYSTSPYAWCGNNPVNAIDPNGKKWFYYPWGPGAGDHRKEFFWEDEDFIYKTQEDGSKIKLQGYDAIVVFEGYYTKTLGIHGKLINNDGDIDDGALMANVTIYGPHGEDDKTQCYGYTMSSDPKRFGVLDNGEYNVNRVTELGPYESPWTIENRGKVPTLYNVNSAHLDRNPPYMNGVFIHRYNRNGDAGIYWNNRLQRYAGRSEGCLLIEPGKWHTFMKQLQDVNSFRLILRRQ